MEKVDIQKLADSKSARLTFTQGSGKSAAWKQFHPVSVDNVDVPYVKCDKCNTLLKWKS